MFVFFLDLANDKIVKNNKLLLLSHLTRLMLLSQHVTSHALFTRNNETNKQTNKQTNT